VRFSIDAAPFEGETFDLVAQNDLTWAEAGDVEKALGVSLVELEDADTGTRLRRSVRFLSVFLWASVRRARPETTYEQVANTPQSALQWLPEESPDPTGRSETDQTTETPDCPT
jgi:hypothetical protein